MARRESDICAAEVEGWHACKEAETDATKRALATFGNPIGFALYDKERRGVRGLIVAGRDQSENAMS